MKILTVIPTQREIKAFLAACQARGYEAKTVVVGKLEVTYLPMLDTVVAAGGLGKTQFAVQTQHLLDGGQWDVAICAGAAGALVDDLAIGDVVIATETVEHDMRNRFGTPRQPRFSAAGHMLEHCRQTLQTVPAFCVHYGPIASGDEDVVEGERRAAIHASTGALVVAWEGAGGARASQFSGVPFIEIRGVTDSADGTAARDFALHVSQAMQNVAHVVLCVAGWGGMDYRAS